MRLTMKEIRKELMKSNIVLPSHVQEEMQLRGYLKKDLISAIWNGEITDIQCHRNELKAVIEGFDTDRSPIVLIIGFYRKDKSKFAVVTAFPPIKAKFKRVI